MIIFRNNDVLEQQTKHTKLKTSNPDSNLDKAQIQKKTADR